MSGLLSRGQDLFPGKMKSTQFLSLVNRKAAYINNKLSNIARSSVRLSYIGHPAFVVDGKLSRFLLSKDGLHLSRDGAAMVVRNLESQIRRLRKQLPANTMTRRTPTTPVFPTSTSAQPPIGPLLFKEVLMTTRAKPRVTQAKQQLQLTDHAEFPSLPSREVSIWDPVASTVRVSPVASPVRVSPVVSAVKFLNFYLKIEI